LRITQFADVSPVRGKQNAEFYSAPRAPQNLIPKHTTRLERSSRQQQQQNSSSPPSMLACEFGMKINYILLGLLK
jgi:hypothetical protein